jgi:hypothetical protein
MNQFNKQPQIEASTSTYWLFKTKTLDPPPPLTNSHTNKYKHVLFESLEVKPTIWFCGFAGFAGGSSEICAFLMQLEVR